MTFKSTQTAKDIITAIADLRHKDIGDLIHEYFYELAKQDLSVTDATKIELRNIFYDAIMS